MNIEQYLNLKDFIINAGYEDEIFWAETVRFPKDALSFFCEYAWVVINSGMKNQIAHKIWHRVTGALYSGIPVFSVFRHPGKAAAIQKVWDKREDYFQSLILCPSKEMLSWLHNLPWIGPITKFHLAKNLGLDVCKPDRHLIRIANKFGKTPEKLCEELAKATGDRIGTVDLVIWRAANLGYI
jgi:hypothetical protein